MPFLLRATPRQDLAGWSLRSEVNLTVTGHSRDTPDQTPDATEHRHVVAPRPPSGHYALHEGAVMSHMLPSELFALFGCSPVTWRGLREMIVLHGLAALGAVALLRSKAYGTSMR